MPRALLILPSATYRATAFMEAAGALDVEVVVGTDANQAFAEQMGDKFLQLKLTDPEDSARRIAERAKRTPLDTVVGVDDQGILIAAIANELLGLSTNPPAAVAATRDKTLMRALLANGGVAQPDSRVIDRPSDELGHAVIVAARELGYPCVVKPSNLAASRGVIRVDDDDEAIAAAARIDAILEGDGDRTAALLVEAYVPGAEIAIEGLLRRGGLEVLAIFDKPDPLEGPYFEETIYVTPSRHGPELLEQAIATAGAACAAIGLAEGPIHAELRLEPGAGETRPVLIEVAARTIGGRCAEALSFAHGASLESIVLAHALGAETTPERDTASSGVMMLPIPSSGRLVDVHGRVAARNVAGITGLEVSIPKGHMIEALPEGSRYLGFLFARAEAPAAVEAALRTAHASLSVEIEAVEAGAARLVS